MKLWGRRALLVVTIAVIAGALAAPGSSFGSTVALRTQDQTAQRSVSADVCFGDGPQLHAYKSEHFHFQYTKPTLRGLLSGGLTLRDYARAFEHSWRTEVDQFRWAPPPPPKKPRYGKRYLVVIDLAQQPGLYGVTATIDTVGDNPATAWKETHARSSCIVINAGFNKATFPNGPYKALLSTAAHEFKHALQFGLGMAGPSAPDDIFFEAAAAWMEDEVYDDVNDNYNFLWPDFDEPMADYASSPYNYWVIFRAFTERLGADGHNVMRELAETLGRRDAVNVHALSAVLTGHGLDLRQAFHDAAVAVSVLRQCGGAYAQPYCFEEADAYRKAAGAPALDGKLVRGDAFDDTLANDLAMARLALPATGAPYSVALANRGKTGILRASVVCDTGAGLRVSAFPTVLGAGQSATLTGVNPAGCAFVRLVVTNEWITPGNPATVFTPAYRVTLS